MTDSLDFTNKPQLSFDEELDVLMAVWNVGQEKKLDLLRPDQIKLLVDNGRIDRANVGGAQVSSSKKSNVRNGANAKIMADLFVFTMRKSLEASLIEKLRYCSREEWEAKSLELKDAVINVFFYLYFEVKPSVLRDQMQVQFSGDVQNAN